MSLGENNRKMSEDAATPAVHSSARDASQRWDSTWSGGDTGSHESMWEVTTVSFAHTVGTNTADAEFDKQSRIIVLYVEVILGAIGGIGVFLWLWHNRRSKSRVNALILHLALSDWLVVLLACLPQLIWEYDRQWRASNAFCKVFKFIQSFAMMASNNMVVVLSIDRHQAIRSPLREAFPVSTKSRQTRDIHPMLVRFWASVVDGEPTTNQHRSMYCIRWV